RKGCKAGGASILGKVARHGRAPAIRSVWGLSRGLHGDKGAETAPHFSDGGVIDVVTYRYPMSGGCDDSHCCLQFIQHLGSLQSAPSLHFRTFPMISAFKRTALVAALTLSAAATAQAATTTLTFSEWIDLHSSLNYTNTVG